MIWAASHYGIDFCLQIKIVPPCLISIGIYSNLIHQKIDDWSHFEELETNQTSQSSDDVGRDENSQIICYGMGSAVSNLFPDHNYIAHNQFVDLEMLSNFINTSKERFLTNNPNVDVFREELSKMDKRVQKALCILVHWKFIIEYWKSLDFQKFECVDMD